MFQYSAMCFWKSIPHRSFKHPNAISFLLTLNIFQGLCSWKDTNSDHEKDKSVVVAGLYAVAADKALYIIISFNSWNYSKGLTLSSFCRWGNWGLLRKGPLSPLRTFLVWEIRTPCLLPSLITWLPSLGPHSGRRRINFRHPWTDFHNNAIVGSQAHK